MKSNFIKIFSGNALIGKRIVEGLHKIGIEAIVKDESESARLGGFSSSMLGAIDLFVHKDEVDKAEIVVKELS
ncbi:MAG: DUF2007 domain-containing protein [Flavobacteriaceae bacterium]